MDQKRSPDTWITQRNILLQMPRLTDREVGGATERYSGTVDNIEADSDEVGCTMAQVVRCSGIQCVDGGEDADAGSRTDVRSRLCDWHLQGVR